MDTNIMDATRCLDDSDPDFKYKTSNDSHSWLVSYPGRLKPDANTLKMSSMKESFQKPEVQRVSTKGKRKKIMEAFYRQIISEEIMGEFESEKIIVEDYETDYMERFKDPDDMPLPGEICSKNEKLRSQGITPPKKLSNESKIEELKNKYPLFLSTPLSFVSQTTGRENFRKNSTITKSPDQNYDNIEY